VAAVVAVAGLLGGQAAAADDFFFKPKDRVLFLGDSITEQYQYTNLIEYYLTTRFPTWDLTFYNAGIGGDTAWGGLNRAAGDVLREHPTAVTINFGMNDGGYRGPEKNIYDNYIRNQNALVKKLTDAGVRVALLSTSPVEARKRKDGEIYNKTLETFCEGLKGVAAEHGATQFDQFHPALAVLQKMAKDNTPFDCFPDSVHTNTLGGLLMADAILTAMHAPAIVSEADLDAGGKVLGTDRCKVSDVKAEGGNLRFTRLDDALPMVLSSEQKQLLPYLDNLANLNRYGLKVTGLEKDAHYELKIDGQKVADLTGDQLGKGVNLALDDLGPITAQSAGVWKALADKNQVLHWRFNAFRRNGANTPHGLTAEEQKEIQPLREQELAGVDRILAARQKKIYEMAQPKPHEFELVRVKA
jgi:lysophospholipase L1-like esterase